MEPIPDIERARAIAAAYIEYAPRTRAEVERRLNRAGIESAVVMSVVDSLCDTGVIDDRAFALAWVESRSRSRGLGAARLEAELRRKGVAPETIAASLATLDPADQVQKAGALARSFIGSADISDAGVRRRLAGYLLRRGHSWETVKQVLCEMAQNMR